MRLRFALWLCYLCNTRFCQIECLLRDSNLRDNSQNVKSNLIRLAKTLSYLFLVAGLDDRHRVVYRTQLPDALAISCAYRAAITIRGGQGRDEVQCKQPF
jgi:hypothetical protein